MFIHEVLPNSPAEIAGLDHGDVIISLNGEKIMNFNEFLLKVAEIPPDSKVQLAIIHDGKIKQVSMTLTDRSKFMAKLPENTEGVDWRGIHVNELDIQKYGKFNIDSGVFVVKIDNDSPASDTNLAVGDIIIEINRKRIKSIDDFIDIKKSIAESKKTILIYRIRISQSGQKVQGYVAVKSE